MKRILLIITLAAAASIARAFDFNAGRATLSPYPTDRQTIAYPDSLTPFFINHVNRHGSRYPTSDTRSMAMKRALLRADSLHTITPLGKELLAEVNRTIAAASGQWGELDTIGMKELRRIAGRMHSNYPQLFDSATVKAISSYVPRCIMSMYSFTHELARKSKGISISTSSGKAYNPLACNFEDDDAYLAFRADTACTATFQRFIAGNLTIAPLLRVLGENYPLDYHDAYDLAMAEYYAIAGMNAMGLDCDASRFFKEKEYNQLWSVLNFRHYLQFSASTTSAIPAEIAAPLLQDFIATADSVINGKLAISAKLRFGHAESLMPLLALIQAPGCYYLTNYHDTVAEHWKDYEIVPMAANFQLIYFKTPSGEVYVRADLNEKPILLLPGSNSLYVKWKDLRLRFLELLPL